MGLKTMRNNMWKEIKYWSQMFLIPVYLLSFLVPRNKNLWAFGSTFGRRFADNPKYFYLYVTQHQTQQVEAVWISKDKNVICLLKSKGMKACYLYSFRGIINSLRAKVYLYDNYSKDICFTLSGGAVKVNLWHGIPLKKIQMDNIFDKVRHPGNHFEKFKWALRRMSDEKPSDYVLTTSELLKPIFASAFRTNNVLVSGYPRNDLLVSDLIMNVPTENEEKVIDFLTKQKNNQRIVFYMPTFRDSEKRFFEVMDISRFEAFLKKENLLFCVKLHPKSKLKEKFQKLQGDNVLVLEPQEDPYPVLSLTDVLITDYSSVYFDFLLTAKPVIFFAYDLEDYLRDSREMYFNYLEFTPGRKAYTQKELEEALVQDKGNLFETERETICKKVFDSGRQSGSQQLYSILTDMLDMK